MNEKEEVKKAVMELKMFGLEKCGPESELVESLEDVQPQIFPDHDELYERYRKTLNYSKLPVTDRSSLPFTQLAVETFTNVGLDALGDSLGRLDVARAGEMTRTACVGPNSLVLALLYLDRLRRNNPDYLTSISSADLFLVSMMVASKFLHDDGEEDEVFNDEWATSGGMDTKELNKLEISFLSAMDWRVFVAKDEFAGAVETVEEDIALREVTARGWATYTELSTLSRQLGLQELVRLCAELTMKMTAVCVAAYAAGFISLLGTAALLERTPAGPSGLSHSVKSLTSCLSTPAEDSALPAPADLVGDRLETSTSSHSRITAADLLTASLLVTSLSVSVSPLVSSEEELEARTDADRDNITNTEEINANYTRSLWLAELSRDTSKEWNLKYDSSPDQRYQFRQPTSDLLSGSWKEILTAEISRNTFSSYFGRCPVLKWGRAFYPATSHIFQPLSFFPGNG